jgi:3-oxoadipate enol-lactonase
MHNREYCLSDGNTGRPVLVLGNSLGTRFSLWNQVSEPLIGNSESRRQRITLIRERGLSMVAKHLANRWFSRVFATRNPAVVDRFARQLRDYPTEEYLARCVALQDADFRDRVVQIRTRTLIIAGSNDPATSVADAEFLHQQIRSSQLLVLPCGHLACVKAPAAFARAVLELLLDDQRGREKALQ